jgi:sialate O-acetylesterase
MSAICFLYAKNIYDRTGVPLGLIDSCVGGTKIESWSTQNALDNCGIEHEQVNCKGSDFTNCNTRLYNKMINPLKRTTLKGFLWYQGESNTSWNMNKYNCSFPAMINEWRSEFASNSNTNKSAPFGFVQLSTIKYGDRGLNVSIIRWHQTADRAIVPNRVLENTFMAVAIDTYDETNGIHPRYKQIVGQRLAIAGMNVAYGNSSFPANGPHPKELNVIGGPTVSLKYNQKITYNQTEISGFYYCCLDEFEHCDMLAKNWVEVKKESVKINSTALDIDVMNIYVGELKECYRNFSSENFYRVPHIAYLWRETPIKGYLAAPIYGKDKFKLPSAPWKVVVL